jgi:hypothetical protein
MGDSPQRIWIEAGDDCPYFYEESELAEVGSPVTEYIRADLCHRPAPADTDTGLETVAWQHQDYDEWHETRVPEYHKNRGKNVRELVTRSQAEAIIRDLETKILDAAISDRLDDEGAPLSWQERAEIAEGIISDLKADNAAKDARIKELEAALDSDPDGSGLWRFWSKKSVEAHQQLRDKTKTIKALEAKLAAASELLRQSRKSLKRAPFNLLVGIDDFLAGTEARAVLGGKPS